MNSDDIILVYLSDQKSYNVRATKTEIVKFYLSKKSDILYILYVYHWMIIVSLIKFNITNSYFC